MTRVSSRQAPVIVGSVTGAGIGLLLLVVAPELHRFETNYLIPTYWKLVFAATLAVSGVGAFALGRGWFRWAAALAGGVLAAYAARIVIDCLRDPTNHNMWPFEIIGDYVATLIAATLGALIGWNARRVADKPSEQGAYAPGWKKPR